MEPNYTVFLAAAASICQPCCTHKVRWRLQRGQSVARTAPGLMVNVPGTADWTRVTDHFWYTRFGQGWTEFFMVDALAASQKPAFDTKKLRCYLQARVGHTLPLTLPSPPPERTRWRRPAAVREPRRTPTTSPTHLHRWRDAAFAIRQRRNVRGLLLADYTCSKGARFRRIRWSRRPRRRSGGRRGRSQAAPNRGGDPVDGLEYQPDTPASRATGRGSAAVSPAVALAPRVKSAQGGRGGRASRQPQSPDSARGPQVCTSFDGKWEA